MFGIVGWIATARTGSVGCPSTNVQVAPASVVLYSPKTPPAYTVLGEVRSIATHWKLPVSTSVQFAPASEDLSTPSPAAYTVLGVAGSMATALRIRSDVNDQLAPASVLRKTPPPSPTSAVA